MYVKKFEASDMKSALLQVKKSMGEDAVILSTRQFKKRGREFGLTGRSMVEVTAAVDSEARKPNDIKRGTRSYSESLAGVSSAVSDKTGFEMEKFSDIVKPLRAEIHALRQDVNRFEPPPEMEQGLKNDIDELKSMVSHLMGKVNPFPNQRIREDFEVYYMRLLSSGVSEKNAAELVLSLTVRPEDSIPLAIAGKLTEKLNRLTSVPRKGLSGRVSSLVGPTGVGKTTTVAKIASELAFSGFKIGLVSIDTYRIAAADQLRIYADIIGVPVFIAGSPEEFTSAISRMNNLDFILVDTVGRSHFDLDGIRELAGYFKNMQVSNHLVLNAGMNEREVDRVVKNFSSCMEVDNFLFSKMDEISVYGTLYNLLSDWGKTVSYITTGQRVPEDIERPTPERLAGYILNPASTGRFYGG